jgi:hypothetical protein
MKGRPPPEIHFDENGIATNPPLDVTNYGVVKDPANLFVPNGQYEGREVIRRINRWMMAAAEAAVPTPLYREDVLNAVHAGWPNGPEDVIARVLQALADD